MGTIYILKNKIDEKIYVGQTIKPFNKRFRQHQQSHSYIGRALRKYGVSNFEKILIENVPNEDLNEEEIKYIKEYNCVSPNGYNLTYGGDNGKLSEESRQKISKSKKGQIPWIKGKHHTNEAKQKMSEAKKGKVSSFKGKAHTDEANEKNRLAHLGKGGESQRHNNEIFIKNAKIIHGDRYNYIEVEYKNCDTKVKIICFIHGEFLQTPYKHTKRKQGCHFCGKESSRLKTIERNRKGNIYEL